MLQRTFVPIAAAGAIALIGISSALADHGELTGDQIRQTLAGAKVQLINDNGVKFDMRFEADGSAKMTGDNRFSDTGTWNIDGDRYCAQWNRFRDGEKACWTVKHLKNGDYRFQGSKEEAAVTATISK